MIDARDRRAAGDGAADGLYLQWIKTAEVPKSEPTIE